MIAASSADISASTSWIRAALQFRARQIEHLGRLRIGDAAVKTR